MTGDELIAEIERQQKADPSRGRLEFAGTDFTGMNIKAVSLAGANLSGCDFTDAKLIDCDLSGATLAGSTFYRTDFTSSKLCNVELAGADLAEANLTNTDLSGAKMSGADFAGANLTGAVIIGADLTGIDLSTTIMPDGEPYKATVHNEQLTSQLGKDRRPLKILLAMPTWTEDLGVFVRIGKTRNPQVPLGLLYLATLAEDKGHHVEFVDCDVENVTIRELCERVAENNYDIVGLTATSPIYHKAVKAADGVVFAGRAYAAYGGVYIVASLFWLWVVEGTRPDRWDTLGALICLLGAAVILLGPRIEA